MTKPKRCRWCGGVIGMATVTWSHRYKKDAVRCAQIRGQMRADDGVARSAEPVPVGGDESGG